MVLLTVIDNTMTSFCKNNNNKKVKKNSKQNFPSKYDNFLVTTHNNDYNRV